MDYHNGLSFAHFFFVLYINDLSAVSESCFLILFADDKYTNIFITGNDIQDICHILNENLTKMQEWLCCNTFSLNVSKTRYMLFTTRNKIAVDVNIMIHNENIEMLHVTKFLGVQNDAQLNYTNPGYGLSLVDTLWNAGSYRQPQEQEGNPMT